MVYARLNTSTQAPIMMGELHSSLESFLMGSDHIIFAYNSTTRLYLKSRSTANRLYAQFHKFSFKQRDNAVLSAHLL